MEVEYVEMNPERIQTKSQSRSDRTYDGIRLHRVSQGQVTCQQSTGSNREQAAAQHGCKPRQLEQNGVDYDRPVHSLSPAAGNAGDPNQSTPVSLLLTISPSHHPTISTCPQRLAKIYQERLGPRP